jgi:hypothetical protein
MQTNLQNSFENCGACSSSCAGVVFLDASTTCGGGKCVLGTCNEGRANCDDDDSNGCEYDTVSEQVELPAGKSLSRLHIMHLCCREGWQLGLPAKKRACGVSLRVVAADAAVLLQNLLCVAAHNNSSMTLLSLQRKVCWQSP